MDIPWQTILNVLGILVTGSIGGAITGAWAANRFAKNRDTETRAYEESKAQRARKTLYLAFLKVLESEVSDNRPILHPSINLRQGVSERFDTTRRELIKETTLVESDFGKTLLERVNPILEMTPGSVDGQEGRQKLLTAIHDLITYVKKRTP